ncbi:MAG: cytochrome c4 [Methylococcaceae bacterium]|nr:cytochrome c4 [Methylococcaceae bacterium]
MTKIQSTNLALLFISLFSFNSFIYAAEISEAEGKKKAALCEGCHGTKGNSKNPQYPSLAGQHATYIEAQLKAFQSGQRANSTMQGMAANLNETDIKNIAAYFSNLSSESAGGDSSLTKKGQDKFAMCAGCHGAKAQGRSNFPKLAGQQPEYLKKQLLNFKNGSRKGGPMNAIVSSLSEQDMNEIAAYLGSL